MSTLTLLSSTWDVGDTEPALNFTVQQDPDAPSLVGSTVQLIMTPVGSSTPLVDLAACAWDNTAAGTGHYTWTTPDVAVAGIFNVQLKVTYAGGAVAHFPNTGPYPQVEFVAPLA